MTGARSTIEAAKDADQRLTSVSASLGFLLMATPSNMREAWAEFEQLRYQRAPRFRYRSPGVDPEVSRRVLSEVDLDRIQDPTLSTIFREKREELDRLITMLAERNTPRFLQGSLQVFGGVDPELLRLARELLASTPNRNPTQAGEAINAARFAGLARKELAHYRAKWPEFTAEVRVRPDVPSLIVEGGHLFVGSQLTLESSRAQALIQHEIGTHLVTFYNGLAQSLHHLSAGFAGYEALQEGLAVLAEHLVGGLTAARLRLIASRVVAVQRLVEGASFVDTFRELRHELGLGPQAAFIVCVRVYRSGGLTKDAIYLRGLEDVLSYLGQGGNLEELFVGKIAIRHVPLVRELRQRGMLSKPRLLPRYLEDGHARARLARLRRGASVLDLLKE